MSITAERKAEVIKSHARGDADTGSAEVAIRRVSASTPQPALPS